MNSSVKQKLAQLDNFKLAWLAGLFQGEASFKFDKRIRSSPNNDPAEYEPPPPIPSIKIEMIEKDLMNYVGELLGRPPSLQKRQTAAGNNVYKVSLEAREDVRAFITAIRPYIVGNKTLNRVDEMLENFSLH